MKPFKHGAWPVLFFLLLDLFSFASSRSGMTWKELHLKSGQSLWASSELVKKSNDRSVRYSVKNIFDGKSGTCWAEGVKGDGRGENITIVVNKDISAIGIINGNAKNVDIFKKNNRIKKLSGFLFIAFTAPGLVSETDSNLYFMKTSKTCTLELLDSPARQYFEFPVTAEAQHRFREQAMEDLILDHPFLFGQIEKELGVRKAMQGAERKQYDNDFFAAYAIYGLVVEIVEVYPGSTYRDTCISEIEIEMI
ncbi:MAG: hypothetical protein JXI33_04890 [Candidatus Aminicenantes bacterium]|nr:hypothetical protein [Candidatus Aminicenantes bacterium]